MLAATILGGWAWRVVVLSSSLIWSISPLRNECCWRRSSSNGWTAASDFRCEMIDLRLVYGKMKSSLEIFFLIKDPYYCPVLSIQEIYRYNHRYLSLSLYNYSTFTNNIRGNLYISFFNTENLTSKLYQWN